MGKIALNGYFWVIIAYGSICEYLLFEKLKETFFQFLMYLIFIFGKHSMSIVKL